MQNAILQYEPFIRFGAFGGVLVLMAFWEVAAPRRHASIARMRRWPNNVGVVIVDTALVRVLFPISAVGLALVAEARGLGLFNIIRVPPVLGVLLSVIILDLTIYFQHVLFHAVPALWRLHRMHHADLDFDVTTGLRFHPCVAMPDPIRLADERVDG